MVFYLNSNIRAPEKVLKLLCWLMWVLSFNLMFPNTWFRQRIPKRRQVITNTVTANSSFNTLCACLSNLHAYDGVDEEEHGDEQADIRQSFEGLDEGPQEDPNGVSLSQQFDETSCSEQLQETHVELINRLVQRCRKREGKWCSLAILRIYDTQGGAQVFCCCSFTHYVNFSEFKLLITVITIIK